MKVYNFRPSQGNNHNFKKLQQSPSVNVHGLNEKNLKYIKDLRKLVGLE